MFGFLRRKPKPDWNAARGTSCHCWSIKNVNPDGGISMPRKHERWCPVYTEDGGCPGRGR